MSDILPVIGNWYRIPGGNLFEVVAIDADDRTVEIQHFDGTVEEIDLESWMDSMVQAMEPPEDWSGSVDMEPEDYGVGTDKPIAGNWASALTFLDRAD